MEQVLRTAKEMQLLELNIKEARVRLQKPINQECHLETDPTTQVIHLSSQKNNQVTTTLSQSILLLQTNLKETIKKERDKNRMNILKIKTMSSRATNNQLTRDQSLTLTKSLRIKVSQRRQLIQITTLLD